MTGKNAVGFKNTVEDDISLVANEMQNEGNFVQQLKEEKKHQLQKSCRYLFILFVYQSQSFTTTMFVPSLLWVKYVGKKQKKKSKMHFPKPKPFDRFEENNHVLLRSVELRFVADVSQRKTSQLSI
jgi:hypothetical protein